jgi:hypothetical protein
MIIRSLIVTLIAGIVSLPAASNTTHFTFKSQTGVSATVGLPLDANPNIDGVPLQPGDEIGVFSPAGLCVGGVVWNGERNVGITVWGNDFFTDEIDGMVGGEQILYRVWQQETGTEIEVVDVEYLMGDGIFQPNGIYRVSSLTAYMPPQVPVLRTPENNAIDLPTDVRFEWSEISTADTYRFQLGTTATFSNPLVDEESLQEASYTVNQLLYSRRYYWRVRAQNYGGLSEWSQVFTFTTLQLSDTLRVPLESNWNMISSYVEPDDPEIKSIFGNIQNSSLFVKDKTGNVYWPFVDIDEIDGWRVTEAYQVYLDAPDTVLFIGSLVDASDIVYEFNRGWNYPSYLHREPMSVDTAFASLRNDIELVKTHTGLLYWPEFFVNTIEVLQPGQGYQMYLNRGTQFVYPAVNEGVSRRAGELSASVGKSGGMPQFYIPTYTNTGESAVLMVECAGAEDGDEVAVWDTLDNLIGSGTILTNRAAVTVWGKNSRTVDRKDGAYAEEPLKLSLWSIRDDNEYELSINTIVDVIGDSVYPNGLRYNTDGIYIVTAEKIIEEIPSVSPTNYSLSQNYPNPFNPSTNIQFSIPRDSYVRLSVYNMLGQEIAQLVDGELPAGQHEVQFEANRLPSGVYLYHLRAGYYVETRRMILVR